MISNAVSANWRFAVDLNGMFEPVTNALVQSNYVEGVIESAIRVVANVQSPDIVANTLDLWGVPASPSLL